MCAIATATAALLVLASTAEAATQYEYGGRDSYEHRVYGREYKKFYHEPSERHYADQDYTREPHHDSYDEDNYGGDAYSEEQTYTHESTLRKSRPSYKQSRRHTRSAREGQFFGHGLGLGLGHLKRIGNSDATVHIRIFTGQAQDDSEKQAQIVDADSASPSDAESEDSDSDANQIENTNIDLDFV